MNDELMIRKLIEDYSDAVNQRDGAAISALWAQDGRWSVPEYEGLADVRGVDAIRSTWESLICMGTVAVPTKRSRRSGSGRQGFQRDTLLPVSTRTLWETVSRHGS